MMLTRRTSALAASGLMAAAAFVGMSATAQAAPANSNATVTFMTDCGSDRVQSPASFTLACADANQSLARMKWSNWGAKTATATGVMRLNMCKPSCAKGKTISLPVRVAVNNLRKDEATQVYTRMNVRVVGTLPKGVDRVEMFNLTDRGPIAR